LFEVDKQIFLWINGLAGRSAVADYIIQGIANDYFVIVSFCLGLLAIWFGSTSKEMQKAVIAAAISIGLASLLVVLSNHFYFRPRPFTELPTNLLFYKPSDSSFPSNLATILMAISIPISGPIKNRWPIYWRVNHRRFGQSICRNPLPL